MAKDNMYGSSLQSYNVKNNGDYYYAGYLTNGNSVLMGLQLPELVMVEFDANGDYLRTSIREISSGFLNVSQQMPDLESDRWLLSLQDWQKFVGFRAATISVKKFFIPDRWIGIKELPDHYQAVIDQTETIAPERLADLQEDIRLWVARGDFVLYWDEEYYLNNDGELESS